MPKHHIIEGNLTVSGQRVEITTGEINLSVEEVETSDTGSGGWQEFLPGGGLKRGEVNFTTIWRDDALINEDPPNIDVGNVLPFVATLFTGRTFEGNIFVKGADYSWGDVTGNDPITCEVSANSSGVLKQPTAAAPAP
jgi:predicted secreted protein